MNPDSKNQDFRMRPATAEDLVWISELQQTMYSPADAVPIEKLRDWFQANPGGFFILENGLCCPVGHMTFLPLRPECLDRYGREGGDGMLETEIQGTDLYPSGEKDSISDLYLESIILPEEERWAAMQSFLRALPEMIAGQRKQGPGRIFALAATPAGERWLAKMGFVQISRAAFRRDGHDMYEAALDDFLEKAAGGSSIGLPRRKTSLQ